MILLEAGYNRMMINREVRRDNVITKKRMSKYMTRLWRLSGIAGH